MRLPRLDFNRWKKLFPLSRLREENDWVDEGEGITSPFHLAIVEQLRDEVCQRSRQRGSPTDIHVLCFGEPTDRQVTKIGGLPYRPAAAPWPCTSDGAPMTFVAQLNFSESRDIVPELPGDVMLVFARENLPLANDDEALRFEWYPLGLKQLVADQTSLTPAWKFTPCYGEIHRTVDYLKEKPFEDYRGGFLVSRLKGLKIGGLPCRLQPDPPDPTGRFLCSIDSVNPVWHHPYPWINVADPIVVDVHDPSSIPEYEGWILQWADGGIMQLYIDMDSGNISWILDSF